MKEVIKMLDIKFHSNNKKLPKIKFKGNSNDILNELMEVNIYVISFVLKHTNQSIKENIDTIDNYLGFLDKRLKKEFAKGVENYGDFK